MAESTSQTPVLDPLASMTADSLEASSLDTETLALVRIAALVAVDAPSVLVSAEPCSSNRGRYRRRGDVRGVPGRGRTDRRHGPSRVCDGQDR